MKQEIENIEYHLNKLKDGVKDVKKIEGNLNEIEDNIYEIKKKLVGDENGTKTN